MPGITIIQPPSQIMSHSHLLAQRNKFKFCEKAPTSEQIANTNQTTVADTTSTGLVEEEANNGFTSSDKLGMYRKNF